MEKEFNKEALFLIEQKYKNESKSQLHYCIAPGRSVVPHRAKIQK